MIIKLMNKLNELRKINVFLVDSEDFFGALFIHSSKSLGKILMLQYTNLGNQLMIIF